LISGKLCLAKLHPAWKLNENLDTLTVKSRLDRHILASWKAMKTQANGILASHTTSKRMMEEILAKEEEHADDMKTLLERIGKEEVTAKVKPKSSGGGHRRAP
jgi:bacterioferritin (cytochrome b1)